jgi:hypothetical protein
VQQHVGTRGSLTHPSLGNPFAIQSLWHSDSDIKQDFKRKHCTKPGGGPIIPIPNPAQTIKWH